MKNRTILEPAVPPRHCTVEQIRAAVKSVTELMSEEDRKKLIFEGELDAYTLKHDAHYHGYVLGFLFSRDLKYVILIRKTHPKSQAGMLNGIGGKIEFGESHRSAVHREFLEETGYDFDGWNYLKPFKVNHDLYCHVFYGVGDDEKCKTMTDEEIWAIPVERLLRIPFYPITSPELAVPIQGSLSPVDDVAELIAQCLNNLHKEQLKLQ
jgi:8-oxo-dGTP diphosphatase